MPERRYPIVNTKIRTRLLGISFAAAIALAACGGAAAPAATAAPAKPTEAPKPTKLTVLCTVTEDWCVAQTKAFEAKTGIKTTFTRLSSGEAATKLKATANNPEYSVWWGGPADGFVQAKGDGTLAAYKSPNAAKIQDKAKDPDGFWTGVYVGALGFCSNKVELDKLGLKPPTSWNDLLDPKLKSKFSVAHPATSGTSYTMVWTQVVLLGSEDKAFEYLKALHPQVAQYTKSGAAPAQAVGRAEAVVGVVFSHDCVAAVDAGFKDVVVSFAKEGTGYEIGAMGLVKGGPEEAAAKMWIDWALTAEAQEIGPTAKAYQLPTNPDAKVSDRSVKLSEVNLINYDFIKAGTAKKGITTKFEEAIAAQPK
ncbi:MAG: ABC transporter substrate-binding protein [Anaerolineae bacterium]|nr:ABC transporter substrate-binding protein [Anaerolineae bacterium]